MTLDEKALEILRLLKGKILRHNQAINPDEITQARNDGVIWGLTAAIELLETLIEDYEK